MLSRAPTRRRRAVLDGQLEGLGGPQHHLLTVGAARCPLRSTRGCRWVSDGTVLAVLSLSLYTDSFIPGPYFGLKSYTA